MKLLESNNPIAQRKTLRRLHIRLRRAPSARMKDLLSIAGVDKLTLDMVHAIVHSCPIDRMRMRPERRPITAVHMSEDFNDGAARLVFLDAHR